MKTEYQVCRYFDDFFEAVVSTHPTEKEATDVADSLNSKPRVYVSYSVRETQKNVIFKKVDDNETS